MRILIVAGALAAAMTLSPPKAEAASYCYDSDLGMTCGFVSLQQCLEALSGVAVGTCQIDPMAPTRETVSPRKRKSATH